MVILGINAFHGDSAAAVVVDGRLVAAAEEERFTRIKHWAGFPEQAVSYCMKEAGVSISDIEHVAVNRNPNANMFKKALFAFSSRPSLSAVRDRLENARKVRDTKQQLAEALLVDEASVSARLHNVEHHRAHLASAFLVSPFETSALLSVDGFGDFVSTMWGVGEGARMSIDGEVVFPHSLGLFYLAITQYLGFNNYGDEYKVMGLAPYGKPTELDKMRQIVLLKKDGSFELNLDLFLHHSEGISMTWDGGYPEVGRAYSDKLEDLLGPARAKEDPIDDRHKNIARSMQEMFEEAFFHLLSALHERTGLDTLCLAGGCAYNSVANGQIFDRSPFKEVYIQAAAGDAGGAIGAAFYVWNQILKKPREFVMTHAYWGPQYTNDEARDALSSRGVESGPEFEIRDSLDEDALCEEVSKEIAAGHVVGWFQGRMEWGPRALGNRSIVCDPRRADMKEILNAKIKRRESFRPFAPSILRDRVGEWFETDYDVPFMLQVYMVRDEKRADIPAVTHVNGTGRLQSVERDQNPRYYKLIESFARETGVPMVLNTSFNENEPVVNSPAEALDCFLRTKMDVLVLNDIFVRRIQ